MRERRNLSEQCIVETAAQTTDYCHFAATYGVTTTLVIGASKRFTNGGASGDGDR